MKKALAIIIALVACLSLAACGGGNNPADSSAPQTSAPAPSESAASQPPASTTPTDATEAPTEGGASKLDAIKAAGEIVMVTSPDFAPYEFIDPSKSGDEQYVGLDLALGRYIAEQLGVKLKIDPMDFDATLAALGTSNCDMGISGYTPSEERKGSMDFTDVYYEGDQVIVVRKEDAEKYKTADSLSGLPVGAQNASEQQNIAETQLEGAEVSLFTKVPEAVMALQSKQIEAVALEGPNARQIIAQNPDLVVSEIKVEGEVAGTAIAVPKGNDDLVAELNKIIAKAKEEGLIEQWLAEAVELNQSVGE